MKDFIDKSKIANFKGTLLIYKNKNFPSDFNLGLTYTFPVIKAYNKEGYILEEVKEITDIIKM